MDKCRTRLPLFFNISSIRVLIRDRVNILPLLNSRAWAWRGEWRVWQRAACDGGLGGIVGGGWKRAGAKDVAKGVGDGHGRWAAAGACRVFGVLVAGAGDGRRHVL
jgi:hypothetical protein